VTARASAGHHLDPSDGIVSGTRGAPDGGMAMHRNPELSPGMVPSPTTAPRGPRLGEPRSPPVSHTVHLCPQGHQVRNAAEGVQRSHEHERQGANANAKGGRSHKTATIGLLTSPHLTDEKTGVQSGAAASPRSHSRGTVTLGFVPS
jgi:hypothetical protein